MPSIGVLALQGDFEAHRKAVAAAGLDAREVRTAGELLSADALILPGGESTAMWKLMEGTGLVEAIGELAASGRPILATCAGAILLSRRITNPDRAGMGLLDLTTVRNAYGRQLDSAVVRLTDLDRRALGDEPLEAVFVGSGIFKSSDPAKRARAIVEATTHWQDPARIAKASEDLGEGMKGIEAAKLVEGELLQTRGW